MFTPRCSPRAKEFPWSVNFVVRRMVAELRVVKVAQFSHFGLFSPHKRPPAAPPKKYIFGTRPTAHWPTAIGLQPITSQNDYDFFRVVVKSPKIWQRGFLATSATCPDFRLWECLYMSVRPSVRLSVCPSVCHMPVSCLNGYTYPQFFYRQRCHSSFPAPNGMAIFRRRSPNWGVECKGYDRKSRFLTYSMRTSVNGCNLSAIPRKKVDI